MLGARPSRAPQRVPVISVSPRIPGDWRPFATDLTTSGGDVRLYQVSYLISRFTRAVIFLPGKPDRRQAGRGAVRAAAVPGQAGASSARVAGNRVIQAEFRCLSCGHLAQAGVNAAV